MLAATLVGKPLVWFAFIAAMFTWPIVRSIHAERELPRERPVLGRVRGFSLRDQQGGELGGAELYGRIWVASFTALECEPRCAPSERLLAAMDEVRRRTRNLGDAIRLVTFPVAPSRGTAERMSELSATHGAGTGGTWRFVSGAPEQVRDVLEDFHIVEGIAPSRVALVDGRGSIRGYYDLEDEAALDVLLRDISLLLAPRS